MKCKHEYFLMPGFVTTDLSFITNLHFYCKHCLKIVRKRYPKKEDIEEIQ